jgi:hypothetical protein
VRLIWKETFRHQYWRGQIVRFIKPINQFPLPLIALDFPFSFRSILFPLVLLFRIFPVVNHAALSLFSNMIGYSSDYELTMTFDFLESAVVELLAQGVRAVKFHLINRTE